MPRGAKLVVVVGQKEIGKTRTTIEMLRQNVREGRKVLIFDTQNEFINREWYPDVYKLAVNQISLFSVNPEITIRRISPFKANHEEMTPDEKGTVVLHILERFTNGILLLEDTNDYIYDNMPQDIVGKILSQRHKGLDLYLHYHSLGRVQKKIWPHINWLRMHKCGDNVIDNIEKFKEKYNLFRIAEFLVDAQYRLGDTGFYVHIDTTKQKIVGDLTDAQIAAGVDQFISSHWNRVMKPVLEERNLQDGSKKYTEEQAYIALSKKLIEQYF